MSHETIRPLILVLEDEAIVAMELEERLEALGYRVAGPVRSTEEALALARKERPDLLLADIRLKGEGDGIAAAAIFRAQLGVPAVYLTAYADDATLARAVASEPFGYLTKPLRELDLHATLTTALHRDRLERALADRERQLEEAQRLGRLGSWEWDLVQDRATMSRPLLELIDADDRTFARDVLATALARVYEDDRTAVRAFIDRALVTSAPLEQDFRLISDAGQPRWIQARAEVDRDASGRPVHLRGILRDVTEARAAARAVESSEARFRAVFEGTSDGVLVVGPDGLVTLVNAAAEALFGYPRAELVGMSIEVLVPPGSRAAHAGQRAAFAASPHPGVMAAGRAVHGMTKGGGEIPLEIGLHPVLLAGERCTVLSARDISARLQRDAEIHRLATIVEHSSECISLSTLDGQFVFLNQAGARMLGIDPSAVEQHRIDEVLPPHLLKTLSHHALPRMLAGQPWEGELQYLNLATGASTDVYCTAYVISDPTTSAGPLLVCASLDSTDKKRVERELALSRERMSHAQRLEFVGRLAGGVAHDFNNLLTVVLGASRLLEPKLTEQPAAQALLADIHEAGSRAALLVARLLAFARRRTEEAGVIDVNEEIRGFTRLLERVVGPAIEFEAALCAGRCEVWIGPTHVEQLLLNLAVNARDAMADGGRLRLRTRLAARGGAETSKKWVVIEVEDDGCGLTEEVQSHMFEPFFTTKPFGSGTGLGLSIVHGLVVQAGGEIVVRSEPGVGTTFAIWLPCHEGKRGHPAESEPEAASVESSTEDEHAGQMRSEGGVTAT